MQCWVVLRLRTKLQKLLFLKHKHYVSLVAFLQALLWLKYYNISLWNVCFLSRKKVFPSLHPFYHPHLIKRERESSSENLWKFITHFLPFFPRKGRFHLFLPRAFCTFREAAILAHFLPSTNDVWGFESFRSGENWRENAPNSFYTPAL